MTRPKDVSVCEVSEDRDRENQTRGWNVRSTKQTGVLAERRNVPTDETGIPEGDSAYNELR